MRKVSGITIPAPSSSEGNISGDGERDGAGNNAGARRLDLVSVDEKY